MAEKETTQKDVLDPVEAQKLYDEIVAGKVK